MTQHEEFEVGQHLDQTLRTALTGVAQLVERISRASSDRDRAAAQALREQLLDQRRARPTDRGPQDGLGPEGQRYLEQAPAGTHASRTAAAWEAAMRDVATSPSDPVPGRAASQLNRESRTRHGVDLAGTVAAAISDGQANAAQSSTSQAATNAAGAELAAAKVLPAYRENLDRGVSPSKAATPDEATHRRQAWAMAKDEWSRQLPDVDVRAAQQQWDALPMPAKTDLYWKQYDTEQARTIGALPAAATEAVPVSADPERGFAPSKAATATERAHRENAWAQAQAGHASTLPSGTTAAQAAAAWKELEWQEKALRYWTAYDDPSLSSASQGAGAAVSRERVLELNGQAADYFAGQATSSSKGGQYLQSRLGQEVLDDGRWQLGYAPAGWTGLTDHLRQGGASDDEIVGAGLGRLSSRGNVVDAFRDRATIGIRDDDGQVVGFVGRDLSGSPQAPRYVNTGQTEAYTKGDHLLGVHEAPPGARLVRTEGPFDAIAVTAAGRGRYAGVAPLGTALTETQADTLAARSGGRMWTAMDADAAGTKATEADFWMLSERGVDVRAVALPHGSDPAQLWQDNPALLRGLLDAGDGAPSAGVAVIDNTLVDLRDQLRAGDPSALEELAATHDRVAATLSDSDRDVLGTYTTARVDELLEGADHARTVATRMDVLDDRADVSAEARRRNLSNDESGSHVDDVGVTPQQAVTGREQAAGRAGDLDAAASRGVNDVSGGQRYDRGALAAGTAVGSEAASARQVSAAGFSQPTRDMLAAAQTRTGTAARPSSQPGQALGRPRSQRR